MFQTTKIQTFESNSQLIAGNSPPVSSCFKLQRYKLLKAIHNLIPDTRSRPVVVSNDKDTNFWKQFTTLKDTYISCVVLFQTTKIQTFESNSQLCLERYLAVGSCFKLQRYKLLKVIHNCGSNNIFNVMLYVLMQRYTFWSNSQLFLYFFTILFGCTC